MKYQAEYTVSTLNTAYKFQSISGKNIDFQGSIANMPFFFHTNLTHSRTCLCVHAGGEIMYSVPVKYTQSTLPYHLLLFIMTGEATICYNDIKLSLKKNDIVFFPAGSELSFSTTHIPFSYALFYLSGTVCEDFHPILCGKQGFYHKSHNTDSIMWRMLPSILSLLPSVEDLPTLHLSSVIHLLFSALVDAEEKAASCAHFPRHIIQMKQLLDSDYQNAHSLEDLERTIGINKYRLCRDFSNYVGTSPIQYLNQIRINEAKHMLRFTNLTIHEIGSAVGIDNTTHFINLFKKNTGITPLQFRQKHYH